MSIFGTILSKIGLGGSSSDATPAAVVDAPAADAAAPAAAAGGAAVDVEAVLSGMSGSDGLNWRSSIVDLMKLLGLDSSLGSRKELAEELGYDGDMGDSASMNVWLQKQVMQQLAANGGQVPDSLKG